MTELLTILAVCVLIVLTYIVFEIIKNKGKVKPITDYTNVVKHTPVEEDTPKFSPPVYELEQWIRDNWKKIKVTGTENSDKNVWKVESDLINCEVFIYPYHMLYSSTGFGLDGEEVTYLVKLYRSLVSERQVKLYKLKEARNRKQLARKLQQLGYGSGEYEPK